MTFERHPLLNFYPLSDTTQEYLDSLLAQATEPNRKIKYAETPLDHVIFAANGNDVNCFDSAIERALRTSNDYASAKFPRAAQEGSPLFLYQSEYPNPHQRQPDEEDLRVIEQAAIEVAQCGKPLAPNQVLFHGGPWPIDEEGRFKPVIKLPKVLSTSLMVSVAATHARYHSPHHVWILNAAEGSQAKALIYPPEGFLKHEFEVLLGAGSILEFERHTQGSAFTIIEATLR